jgi:hypothetical protein
MEKAFGGRSLTGTIHRRVLRWAAVTALLCAAPLAASAAEPDAVVEAAKELLQKGQAAMKQGDRAEALILFHKSYSLAPTFATRLYMASCEEQLGLTASAWLHYLKLWVELPADDERVPFARERTEALEPRVPRLQIKLAPGAPPGTRIMQDNVELPQGDLDAVLPVDPTPHVIVVTAPGRKDRRYEVKVAEGARETLTVEPGPVSAAMSQSRSGRVRAARTKTGAGR